MKVAYIHDWLVISGGAEKVAREILACFPKADVFCLVDFLDHKDRDFILHGKSTKTSFIQNLPFAKSKYRNYLPLFPLAIEQFDLSEYDLVISSSYAVAKGVLTHSNQTHICYCHSPMRYAWDLYHHYLDTTPMGKWKRRIAKLTLHYLRNWDIASANRVDYFIANSDYIKRRIEKIYRRDAVVIHPPVAIDQFSFSNEKKDYYIAFSRLVPYKKLDLIAEAFRSMPDKKLIIAGGGPELKNLRKNCPENVTVTGELPFSVLLEKIQHAKALIVAAEEDFGLTPVEAQACGTPVIAFRKGGYLETVIENQTGVFFSEQTAESIQDAVYKFEAIHWKYETCRKNAEEFSNTNFKTHLLTFIQAKLKTV